MALQAHQLKMTCKCLINMLFKTILLLQKPEGLKVIIQVEEYKSDTDQVMKSMQIWLKRLADYEG